MLPIRPVRVIKRYEEHVDFYRYTHERESRKRRGDNSGGSGKPDPMSASFPYAKEAELHSAEQFARAVASVLSAAAEVKSIAEELNVARPNSLLHKRAAKSSHPEIATAQAEYGSEWRTIRVEIRRLAVSQINRTAFFVPEAPTTIRPGFHRLSIRYRGQVKAVEVPVFPEDHHRAALTRLRSVIQAAELPVLASIETDSSKGRIRLVLEGREPGSDNAFTLEDLTGNTAGATGLLITDRPAADAEIHIDGGAVVWYPANRIPLPEYRVKLQLHRPSAEPVLLTVMPDIPPLIPRLQGLLRAVNDLGAELDKTADYLNPTFARSLAYISAGSSFEWLSGQLTDDAILLGGRDGSSSGANLEPFYRQAVEHLAAPDGLISGLLRWIRRMEAGSAEDLLNRSHSRYKRYANYLSSLEWYSQLPTRGLILNRHL